MDNLRVPKDVNLRDITANHVSLSANMYRNVIIPTNRTQLVRDLLDSDHPFDKGKEPGSVWYMKNSTHYMIRTKALQDDSYLLYPKGDAIILINPKVFRDPTLLEGDILMSKDSNVGECAVIDSAYEKKYMFSGGVVRLHPIIDHYYFFSFLKHPLFKNQLRVMTARAATISHSKTLWLDCRIPFPNQSNSQRVIDYVSILMQAIVDKEKMIREKNRLIDLTIEEELIRNQNGSSNLIYSLPTIDEIKELNRLDASMYTEDFKRKQFLITKYQGGYTNYDGLGFEITRGQNLQVSCIGKSIYSNKAKPGFYRLVAPTDISEFRTVRRFRYIGNRKTLSLLKQGDIIFGAEGFCKGRVVILADEVLKTISNIHGVILHPRDGDINKGIFLGCFLGYLRSAGLVDAIGAGGSGGSLAIGYFEHVPIPIFPDTKWAEIALLYHNLPQSSKEPLTLGNFLEWHKRWNKDAGIWELDQDMKSLHLMLSHAQEQIIKGDAVEIPIAS